MSFRESVVAGHGLTKRYGSFTAVDAIDILPTWARLLAWCLPLTHVSLIVRGLALGWLPDGWGWSLLYLILAAAITFVSALFLMKQRFVK